MIYLNNAATTYPKPLSVKNALLQCIDDVPDGQMRSSGSTSMGSLDICRENLGALFNIPNPSRIFFTSGATESFNLIIRGLAHDSESRILTTVTEHNSVLRPLFDQFPETHIDFVSCDANGCLMIDEIKTKLTGHTIAFFVNHCSNVTGVVQDIQRLRELTSGRNILLVVDASQSAGEISIDVQKTGIDVLVFTAHKGLFGIQGSGGIYIREGISCRPLKYGGTGLDSWKLTGFTDESLYESGTQNSPGIVALSAGVDYIRSIGLDVLQKNVHSHVAQLYRGLIDYPEVTVYGNPLSAPWGPVLSFNVRGFSPSDIGYILESVYDIRVRTGLHCAPLIHRYLGTAPSGTIRVSPSLFTTDEEIKTFIDVIGCITGNKKDAAK